MIELKNEDFKNQHLTQALVKLGNCSKFPPKFAMKVCKMVDAIHEQEGKIGQDYVELIKAHAVVDEKGNYIPKEDPNGKPQIGTFQVKNSDAWEKAYEEFSAKKIAISAEPLPLKELEGVGLTPLELRSIKSLVVEMVLV